MERRQSSSWWSRWPWTLGLSAILVLLNLGAVLGGPPRALRLLTWLQWDSTAVEAGEWWRVLTGNLVHWSPNHFYLDVGVFLVLGLLYEPAFGRAYPWLLLVLCLGAGLPCLWFMPERSICRGLSGVDSGLFAAALGIEFGLAAREPSRWLWVGPAAGLFVAKSIYEAATGRSAISSEAILGPMSLAAPIHIGGAIAGAAFVAGLALYHHLAAPAERPSPEPRAEQDATLSGPEPLP